MADTSPSEPRKTDRPRRTVGARPPFTPAVTSPRPQRRTLRQTRERYRSLVENAVEGIFQTSPEGRYLMANPMLAHIYGYDSVVELMDTMTDIAQQLYVDPERRTVFRQLLQEQGAVQGFESEVYRRDGDVIWISESARAIRDAEGQLLGYEGTVEDITLRRRAEQERESALAELQAARDELEIRVQERTQELEQAHRDLADAEAEKKRFYREVIRCVTRDKFHLLSRADEVPAPDHADWEWPLNGLTDYPPLRQKLGEFAEAAGMMPKDAGDLVLAVGEAVTNAIKHAANGVCSAYRTEDGIIVRVRDSGSGIQTEDLPATILMPGFSKAVSLGMGFTLMLELVDRVYLATDVSGTVLQLEKRLHPTAPPLSQIFAAWDQL